MSAVMQVSNSGVSSTGSASQILVVDDIEANLTATEAALGPLGRPLVMASSGTEALARLLEQDFALALLDVQMPEMDGFELAQMIRSRPRTSHLPIIFVTAHSYDERAILRAYELGAIDFLFKPVSADIMRAKASILLQLQERTEELALERLERQFENRRRDHETAVLEHERDREQHAKQDLEALDRRKDTFLAMLAHELRNPLAPIRSAVDLIRHQPDAPVPRKVLDTMDRQVTALTRLVDDLLDLSRIKEDKIELRVQHVALRDLVDDAVAMCKPGIDDRGHTLTVDVASSAIVAGDPIRLVQVFSNVLTNAARYTPNGGRIDVRGFFRGDDVVVTIADNGLGIPRELQATIFDAFVQERVSSSGSGGLGLGLALSHRLIELHRGAISVCSDGPDTGSTFEIRLPRSTAASVPVRAVTSEPVSAPDTSVARIVIVDDHEDVREMMADLLRVHGYEIVTASDGASAIELIARTRPDIGLVDLGLPDMDGFAIATSLRERIPDLETRLVALTGYGDASTRERTVASGFHAHLVKPAAANAVVECIREQLARRARR